MTMSSVVGLSSGSVIDRKVCHQLAPSICAASIRLSGMLSKAVRRMIILYVLIINGMMRPHSVLVKWTSFNVK